MRITSLVLLALALSLSASAEDKANRDLSSAAPESGIFLRLQGLFDAGVAPFFPPVGMFGYAGRCFDAGHENAVKGAAYLVNGDGTGNGPIDNGKSVKSVWSGNLTQYDAMSIGEADRGTPAASWYAATFVDGSLATTINSSTGSFLRKNGNYLIEKIANADGSDPSYYCYYYIRLRP